VGVVGCWVCQCGCVTATPFAENAHAGMFPWRRRVPIASLHALTTTRTRTWLFSFGHSAAAKRAFTSWGKTDFAVRKAAMLAFAAALDAQKAEIAEVLSKEQGKPLAYAMGEVMSTVKKCKHLAEIGELKPSVVDDNKRMRSELHYTPRGVVGGITPWNFPIAMAANKILPAVITGNTVVLKPSP
jgi:acyl-CoA reductase-like NAD-dependent aldehyde dehydrogenase